MFLLRIWEVRSRRKAAKMHKCRICKGWTNLEVLCNECFLDEFGDGLSEEETERMREHMSDDETKRQLARSLSHATRVSQEGEIC